MTIQSNRDRLQAVRTRYRTALPLWLPFYEQEYGALDPGIITKLLALSLIPVAVTFSYESTRPSGVPFPKELHGFSLRFLWRGALLLRSFGGLLVETLKFYSIFYQIGHLLFYRDFNTSSYLTKPKIAGKITKFIKICWCQKFFSNKITRWVFLGIFVGVVSGIGAAGFFYALQLAKQATFHEPAGYSVPSAHGEDFTPHTPFSDPRELIFNMLLGLICISVGILLCRMARVKSLFSLLK